MTVFQMVRYSSRNHRQGFQTRELASTLMAAFGFFKILSPSQAEPERYTESAKRLVEPLHS